MASYVTIESEDHWKRKFKYSNAKYDGPGFYNKDDGVKDEPSGNHKIEAGKAPGFAARGMGRVTQRLNSDAREVFKGIAKANPGSKIDY